MPTEILMLVLTGLLSLVVAVLTIGIHFARFGGKAIRSNRDDYPPLEGLAMRVVRAHANLNEALLPFAVIALAASLLHVSNPVTIYAAIAFFAARVAHRASLSDRLHPLALDLLLLWPPRDNRVRHPIAVRLLTDVAITAPRPRSLRQNRRHQNDDGYLRPLIAGRSSDDP